MTSHGIVLIDLVGLALIVLILNLVRTHKLIVGYAVLWCLAVGGMMIIISAPPLLALVTELVGATFPASALSLLAFIFVIIVLIFFSVQLSLLSARQSALIQELGLKELLAQGQATPSEDTPADEPG
ncbi:MAG: DUF2304 domain-containing protein [Candidatus Promineifilaceae bacterium]